MAVLRKVSKDPDPEFIARVTGTPAAVAVPSGPADGEGASVRCGRGGGGQATA